jgi:hypothetical protein
MNKRSQSLATKQRGTNPVCMVVFSDKGMTGSNQRTSPPPVFRSVGSENHPEGSLIDKDIGLIRVTKKVTKLYSKPYENN